MAVATVTITAVIPAAEKKHVESWYIQRLLTLAAQEIRSNGGEKTSGTMYGSGGLNMGTWSYTPGTGST
jgi:hypothetical protein